MFQFLLRGVALGATAGLNPGPLTTLVITTSLEGGFREGLRVAAAPLITDVPIILIAVFLVRSLPTWTVIALATAGGLYLVYLGIKTILRARFAAPPQTSPEPIAPELIASGAIAQPPQTSSLRNGVMVNMLSPNPWLFWITVGAPLLIVAWGQSPAAGLAFILGFYMLLVGSKVLLALLISATRSRLNLSVYRAIFMASGGLLILLGLQLFYQAYRSAL